MKRAIGGPVESGYPPYHPQRKRLRTQTTKTAVARPRGNAISIPGWSWGRLEPPAPWGQGPGAAQAKRQGWIAQPGPQDQRPKGMRNPQEPQLKTLQWGAGEEGSTQVQLGGQEGAGRPNGPQAPGCAAPRPGGGGGGGRGGCQGMRPGSLCQLRAGTGGVRGARRGPAPTPSPTPRSLWGGLARWVARPPLTALLQHRAGPRPRPLARHPGVRMPGPGRSRAGAGNAPLPRPGPCSPRARASGVCV